MVEDRVITTDDDDEAYALQLATTPRFISS